MREKIKPPYYRAYIIFLLSSLFFVYEFFIQVSPAVMTQELMQDLRIGAGGLGILSAFYYYAYTPMQLPAGLLLDRFGPRILLTAACFICAAGALLLSFAHGLGAASLGRFCMGIGSAFAFTGTLILVSRWFPGHYFAILAGVLQLLSSVGALIGAEPLARAVNQFGWRPTIFWIAIAGFILMFFIGLIVRDAPTKTIKHTAAFDTQNEWKRLQAVCKKLQTWIIALFAFSSWAPIIIIAGLWGVPFLMTKYHWSNTAAAAAVAMVWWGVALGSPVIGVVSEKIKNRKMPLLFCAGLALLSGIFIIYVHLPTIVLYILFACFGFAAGSQTLTFAVVKDSTKPERVGTAMGFNNMMVVAGGAILQPLIGFLLHLSWSGAMQNGVPFYAVNEYQHALVLVPLCSLLGIIACCFIKESYVAPAAYETTVHRH